jgi:predicted nucleic acid-binding protein
MIIPDTSIWIDHFRQGLQAVAGLADRADILLHPFVLAEISLGSLPNREWTLRLLRRLIRAEVAHEDEVAALIEHQRLFGTGLGFVDVHLLASTRLTGGSLLWSKDRRLAEAAERLGVRHTATD